jgi:uncharacterized protein (DUF302 family)
MRRAAIASCAVALTFTAAGRAQSPNDAFIVKSSSKASDAVVAAIKSYAELKKWPYLGENKVKQGEVTLVKVCIPEVAGALWPAGLQVSALLPCGNVGVYSKGGATEVSLLHPRYMHVLYPHAATERAGAIALPLFTEMLNDVTR